MLASKLHANNLGLVFHCNTINVHVAKKDLTPAFF